MEYKLANYAKFSIPGENTGVLDSYSYSVVLLYLYPKKPTLPFWKQWRLTIKTLTLHPEIALTLYDIEI